MAIKIVGSRKSGKQCFFTLEKKQEFFSSFRKLLVALGFGDEESKYEIYSFGKLCDKYGEPTKNNEIDITSYIDKDHHFENKEYSIEVIFGKRMVFLLINSNKNKQRELSKHILAFFSF